VGYNRVGLTQYFSHRDPEKQLMKPRHWYDENQIEAHVGDLVEEIDTENKMIRSKYASWVPYDICVIATGSSAAVPPNAPTDMDGVFCYRTIEDLDNIIDWAAREDVSSACVVGGGLLGLEAAKAAMDLNLKVSIFERADRLMSRQLDKDASDLLESEINKLGITTSIGYCPDQVVGALDPDSKRVRVSGLKMSSDEESDIVPTDMLIYSIGIRPRDELCTASGDTLIRGSRGGIVVAPDMSTSAPDVYAIGECASFNDMCYGLVAPCNDMADVVAKNLTNEDKSSKQAVFRGNDMSTKLKLMGVYVASFGDVFPDTSLKTQPLTYRDPFKNVYKKYIFSKDGKHLLGGIMVGDTNDYVKLLAYVRSGKKLDREPSELILGVQSGEAEGAESLPDDTQICSCFNIAKGDIRKAIKEQNLTTVDQVKAYTKAGTGCGGCVPSVTEIFEAEMKALGRTVTNTVCRDFNYSRAELYTIVKVKGLRSYGDIVTHCAIDKNTMGCEVCKPTCASILASLYNENVLDAGRGALQETNDRYLANIQRGGLYSVVPRIAAGEITPDKLAVIAQVAKQYNLYTKITGAQRIDVFGARKEDLPDIWEIFVDAGFER
jgi:NAD(P)H-dependent nitrite reductase large subunit